MIKENKKMKEQKKEQSERPCRGIRLQFTKIAVWPRNGLG